MSKNEKCPYGKLLVELISESKMTQSDFYGKLGITKPYFYDIISGKVNPPPPEMQIKIINILKPPEIKRNKLLTEAGVARNEIPADIMIYLRNNPKEYSTIRRLIDYSKLMKQGGI